MSLEIAHLDPRSRSRGRAGRTARRGISAASSPRETIERYVSESLRGARRRPGSTTSCRCSSHRFARERLRALAQVEGKIDQAGARGAVRLRPQRRAQPDGGRSARPARRRAGPCALGRLRSRPTRSTRPSSRRWPRWARPVEGVPEAADRRGRAGRRRRDHDGLRRRLPDLPRQALRGLGARRPRRPGSRDGPPDPRSRSRGASRPALRLGVPDTSARDAR